jgi:hypothetical protein
MVNVYIILVKKPEEKRPLNLDVGRKIILEWIFKKWGLRMWIGFIWIRIGTSGRLL